MPIHAPTKNLRPSRRALRIDGLRPIERGRRIREFAGAVVERSLAAANAAKVETQHRKSTMRERVVALVDDLMIHGAVKLRVRMQHHRGSVRSSASPDGNGLRGGLRGR